MCRFLSVFVCLCCQAASFTGSCVLSPKWFLSINFPQVYSLGIFFRELFLFCTQSAFCVAFTSDVFCSLYHELEGRVLPSASSEGCSFSLCSVHMPLFSMGKSANRMALLDGFFSNGSRRSLAVCWPKCYLLPAP